MDFLEDELEEILNIFREESEEQIEKLNQNLLKLEAAPKDKGLLVELFRDAHSIKGAARMIGFNDIQLLAHKLEDILGFAKDDAVSINPAIIDLLCTTVDCISSLVEKSVQTKGEIHIKETDVIVGKLEVLIKQIQNGEIEDVTEPQLNKNNECNVDEIKYRELNTAEITILIELINNSLKNIEELKNNSKNTQIIEDILNNTNSIVEIVKESISKDILEYIFNVQLKLDSVLKGSGILLDAEVFEINENLIEFIRLIKELIPALQSLNEKTIQKPLKSSTMPELDNETSNQELFELDKLVEFIADKTLNLHNSEDKNSECNIIIETIELNSNSYDDDVNSVLNKIKMLTDIVKKSLNLPDKEILKAITQSYKEFLITDKEDYPLIIQKINIFEQMLKLSEQEIIEPDAEINTENITQNISNNIKNEIFSINEKQNDGDKFTKTTSIKTLRVDTKKLDQLVNQVGELIVAKIKAKDHLNEIEKITRSIEEWHREWNKSKQFIKHFDKFKNLENFENFSVNSQNKNISAFFEESSSKIVTFINHLNSLHRTIQEDDARLSLIVNELEEMVKSVRVLPLATIFHMFPRMVRDISREKGKDIELIITGSETSVDKKIIEEIKSPLTHIIRNAIDHGIETKEERIANGKNPTGKIILSACHLENTVLIEVSDDGKGIDLEAIKAKALNKGLLSAAEINSMSDNQIMNIIFWSGFSTGETVTDISGRGVGLDVVHTKITHLNGQVNIKSTIDEGCKVSIKLPVTMATIQSFLVEVNEQTLAIPTSSIKNAFWINKKEVFYKEGRETIIFENKTVPVCKLSTVLEMPNVDNDSEKSVVVIIEAEDVQVGFIVDKLLNDQEILHKNLPNPLLRVRNVAGVTTLGSGELCLILNVNDLVKSAYLHFGANDKFVKKQTSKTNNNDKKKVLVVDDSVTTRILERNILRASNYDVTVAVNGLDALTKLASDKFDIIVSDVEMPEINGLELTERVKSDNNTKDIPIILVTSLATESDKQKGFNLGADAYIVKGSFNQEELLYQVRRLLSQD